MRAHACACIIHAFNPSDTTLHVDRYDVFWESVRPPHSSAKFKAPAKTFYKPPAERADPSALTSSGSPRAPRPPKRENVAVDPDLVWNPAVDVPMGVAIVDKDSAGPDDSGVGISPVDDGHCDATAQLDGQVMAVQSSASAISIGDSADDGIRDKEDAVTIVSSSDCGSPLPQVGPLHILMAPLLHRHAQIVSVSLCERSCCWCYTRPPLVRSFTYSSRL